MKKILSLVILSCITLASFAAPWDLGKPKKVDEKLFTQPFGKSAFDDPWVRVYAAYDMFPYTYYHKVRVVVEFNKSVGVPYYAIVRVHGDFLNGDPFREYYLTLTSSQFYKEQDFPLQNFDEIYTEITELVEYGPL